MKLYKILAVLGLCAVVYTVAGYIGDRIESHLLHKYIVPDAYIAEIKTKTYSKKDVLQVLHEFNSMAEGRDAVLFQKHVIDRKIIITDAEDLEIIPLFLREPGRTTIGRALETELNCTIILKTGLDYATFRSTLVHEYLHCMGFDHVDADNDLMSAVDKDGVVIPEENIKEYAKKVADKIWKNLKN